MESLVQEVEEELAHTIKPDDTTTEQTEATDATAKKDKKDKKQKKEVQTFTLPTISKPPIFNSKKQLIEFFK